MKNKYFLSFLFAAVLALLFSVNPLYAKYVVNGNQVYLGVNTYYSDFSAFNTTLESMGYNPISAAHPSFTMGLGFIRGRFYVGEFVDLLSICPVIDENPNGNTLALSYGKEFLPGKVSFLGRFAYELGFVAAHGAGMIVIPKAILSVDWGFLHLSAASTTNTTFSSVIHNSGDYATLSYVDFTIGAAVMFMFSGHRKFRVNNQGWWEYSEYKSGFYITAGYLYTPFRGWKVINEVDNFRPDGPVSDWEHTVYVSIGISINDNLERTWERDNLW